MYDSPYDSEEEVDACIAQEVAIEHEDFVDEILEESPETIQTTSDTSLAISRDSDAISGGGSNANNGGGSSTVKYSRIPTGEQPGLRCEQRRTIEWI
jgi:hypothetical protein